MVKIFTYAMKTNINSWWVSIGFCVSGTPKPDVSWYLNGSQLGPSDAIIIVTEEDKVTLTLKGITPDKAGEITCKVLKKPL